MTTEVMSMGLTGFRTNKNQQGCFQSICRALLVATILSVLTACSTVKVHLQDHHILHPYLGTKTAIHNFIRSFSDFYLYGEQFVRGMDVPFCFVADTLLLPYDLMVKLRRHQRQRPVPPG
ncbi:MAG: YceK/YidQ family lipoprotein [Candidatus Thiodiazotropha endolucinida]|nr:YceK/YidQ family lipoprotein [Candidatus Thiodiazotropha taylori]MCW4274854.1 YceK/YidQ family lipoprotein [Candidatus Thiodiazotropha taylori]